MWIPKEGVFPGDCGSSKKYPHSRDRPRWASAEGMDPTRKAERQSANFYFDCQPQNYYMMPYQFLHHETSRPGESTPRRMSNGEPPSEHRPPGTTKTRLPPSFQEQVDRSQRYRQKQWEQVQSRRMWQVLKRGWRVGQEPGVELELRTLLRHRHGHLQPKNEMRVPR